MGAIGQAFGQFKEGQIAAAQGDFEKKIALRNQKALERQAKAEREAASIEESRISRKGKATVAAAIAQAGKTGGQLKNASLSALTDIVAQFSIDRNLVLRRGLIKSRELKQRGAIIAAQGRFAKTIGRQRRTAAFIGAGATLGAAAFGGGGGGQAAPGATSTTGISGSGTGQFTRGFAPSTFGRTAI